MNLLYIMGTYVQILENFWELVVRFGFNILATTIVVLLYARISRRKEFYFSYFAISIAVFLMVYLLENVEIEIGFALGLFAIFGIIRYRTDSIPPKEMTYLFVIIAVSVINGISKDYFGYMEITLVNVIMVGSLGVLEKVLLLRQEDSLQITYENIENLHKNKEKELLADIEKRTGIKIKRYRIDRIDFLRDVARITIFFDVNGSNRKE